MMIERHSNHGLRKICDCPRRAWPKCGHSWHFAFKWQDTHHRFSIDKHVGQHVDRKADAEDIAANLRTQIKAGTFGQPAPRAEMTLRQLAAVYHKRYVDVEHAGTAPEIRSRLNVICGTLLPRPTGGTLPFGEWRLADIVTDTVERYREARHAAGTGLAGTNRSLARLRALYNWGVRTGYVEHTPFKRNGEAVVRLSRETPRSRRLDADRDEEARLLAVCAPHLRAVVEAALATGCRIGELLSLTWQQVVGLTIDTTTPTPRLTWAPRSEMVLTAAKTKTRRDRRVPISARLKAILEMRALDPTGRPFAADRFVFGNTIGQRVLSIKRAWMTAVLKANEITAEYDDRANLSPASRAAFAQINLHMHDLRREAGSRWLEGGVPLHTVRDWLGHTSIAQTSTYLSGTAQTQHDAMAAYEARLASLQQLATDARTGGRKSPPAAQRHEESPRKTAGGRQSAIM
jgi:integrase